MKNKAIKFWITEEDKKLINIAVSLSGISKGDYLRNVLVERSKEIINSNLVRN